MLFLSRMCTLAVLLLSYSTGICFAQTQSPNVFEHLFHLGQVKFTKIDTQSHPLAGVRSIHQDSKGFIWLTSDKGLYRYDGYSFKPFRHQSDNQDSLSANYVRSFWIDQNDWLWAGLLGFGLNIIDQSSVQNIKLSSQASSPLQLLNDDVNAIKGNNKNKVAIASKGGLELVTIVKGEISVEPVKLKGTCDVDLSNNYIFELAWQATDILWIAGKFGLCKIKVSDTGNDHQGELVKGLAGKYIRGLHVTSNEVWVGTISQQLFQLSTDTNELTEIELQHDKLGENKGWILGISPVFNDELWLSTFGVGILVVDKQNKQLKNVFMPDNNTSNGLTTKAITSIMQDKSGIVWVSTWGEGVYKIDPSMLAYRKIVANADPALGPSAKSIKSIAVVSNDKVIFGGAEGGTFIFDGNNRLFKPLSTGQPLDKAAITVIKRSPTGALWVATMQGLYIVQPDNNQVTPVPLPNKSDYVLDIAFAAKEPIAFLGTTNRLLRFNWLTSEFTVIDQVHGEQAIFKSSTQDLLNTPGSGLWLASTGGLYWLAPNDDKLTAINHGAKTVEQIPKINTYSLAEHVDGSILVSNESLAGLYKIDPSTKAPFSVEILSNKLHPQNITVAGTIWVDPSQRIWNENSVYYPKEQHWEDLFVAIGDKPVCHMNSGAIGMERYILLGCTDGIVMIDAQQWLTWRNEAEPEVTAMQIDGEDIHFSSKLVTLAPQSQSITVQFSALDFKAPDKVRYQHRLVGFDTSWQNSNERRATYTNLAPGQYRLEVKSTNSVGMWSQPQKVLSFNQSPMWYETHLFYLFVVLLIIFSLIFVVSYRERHLKAKAVELNRLVEDKTRRIERLGDIGKDLTGTLELDEVISKLHDKVHQLVYCDVFLIATVDYEKDLVNVIGCFEDAVKLENFDYDLNDMSRPASWCIAQNKELVCSSEAQLNTLIGQKAKPPLFGDKMQSILYLPIQRHSHVIGCLSVQSRQKDQYQPVDLNTLKTIASYAAVAIENALAHTYLLNAQEKLTESEKLASLSHVVTGVAHEINTPLGVALTAITGLGPRCHAIDAKVSEQKLTKNDVVSFSSMVKETESLVEKSLQRCSKLIREFKRLSAEQEASENQIVDLKDYIEKLFQAFEFTLNQHEINYCVEGGNPKANLDPGILSQIMGSLINNVIAHAFDDKHINNSEREDKRIEVYISADDNQAHIRFADNGVGIKAESLKQIFVPFYTTARGKGNKGLGLNVVYNLTKAGLGGELTMESTPNEGMTIYLVFPLGNVC